VSVRDLSIKLLAAQRVPELQATRNTCAANVARLEAERAVAAQSVSIWERLAFFYTSPDEKRVKELDEALEKARAELEEATRVCDAASKAAWQECAPLEIAHRVESLIAALLAQPVVGRGAGEKDFAGELEELGDRVLALWAPGVDTEVLTRTLADDRARAAIGLSIGAPRAHAVLGWEPIDERELTARAAHSLSISGFEATRAAARREAAELQEMTARLEEARAALTLGDRLLPGKSGRQEAVSVLESAVGKEEAEMLISTETVLHALERALGAYPPLGVHVTARAVAGALRAGAARSEYTLDPRTGELAARPAAYLRAFALAAMVELRRAAEAAFPGVPQLVSGRGGERDARDLERAARAESPSPYRRESHAAEDEPPEPRAHTSEAAFFAELERWQLRPLVGRALSHATMVGALEGDVAEARRRVGLLERVAFWSDSESEAERDQVVARQAWHRALLEALGLEAQKRITHAASAQPQLGIHALLVDAHRLVQAVHTLGGSSGSPRHCPAIGRDEAVAAVDSLNEHLSRHYGPEGTRDHLVDQLAARLQRPDAQLPKQGRILRHDEMIDALASLLRGTAFPGLVERVRHTRAQHRELSHASEAAAAQVSFWDKLNVFSDTDAEKQRDQYGGQAQAALGAMQADMAAANALLDEALAWYPPAQAYYALHHTRAWVAAIRAESRRHTTTTRTGNTTTTRTYYTCELVGRDAAARSLAQWTLLAMRVFGALPSASDILERWVVHDLTQH
jgi:hypothetical protein